MTKVGPEACNRVRHAFSVFVNADSKFEVCFFLPDPETLDNPEKNIKFPDYLSGVSGAG